MVAHRSPHDTDEIDAFARACEYYPSNLTTTHNVKQAKPLRCDINAEKDAPQRIYSLRSDHDVNVNRQQRQVLCAADTAHILARIVPSNRKFFRAICDVLLMG